MYSFVIQKLTLLEVKTLRCCLSLTLLTTNITARERCKKHWANHLSGGIHVTALRKGRSYEEHGVPYFDCAAFFGIQLLTIYGDTVATYLTRRAGLLSHAKPIQARL